MDAECEITGSKPSGIRFYIFTSPQVVIEGRGGVWFATVR